MSRYGRDGFDERGRSSADNNPEQIARLKRELDTLSVAGQAGDRDAAVY